MNWWEGFFGGIFASRTYQGEDEDDPDFPVIPRAGKGTIDVAVRDMLTSWLVEGQPNLAVAYFDAEAYECFALNLEERGETYDRGLAPVQLFMAMTEVNQALGRVDSLEGVTIGVRIPNPNLRLVRQDHHRQFVLLAVPTEIAETLKCGNYTEIADVSAKRRVRIGEEKLEHFLSTFHIKGPERQGVTLSLLWAKRDGSWKVVALRVGGPGGWARECVAGRAPRAGNAGATAR